MPTVTKTLGEGTQSVFVTMTILEHLAKKNGPISVSDLAKEIGTSKSRVFRHLQTLVSLDYIARHDAGSQYVVGPRLRTFCSWVGGWRDLANEADLSMHELRDAYGHAVIVSRVDHSGIEVLKSLPSTSPISLEIRAGTILPFSNSAQGKIAMTFLKSSDSEKRPFDAAKQTFAKEHPEELEAIRRNGWAIAQMREGLNGIAAPIFDGSGNLIGTLALLDTLADIGREISPATANALRSAAARVSVKMGAVVLEQ